MKNVFQWTVVGAGPAGIAAVGSLLDKQVPAEQILWVDPQFQVGDFGTKWSHVPSNTKVKLFLKFLHYCKSFQYSNCGTNFALNSLVPDETCELSFMVEPLLWVTETLKKQVCVKKNTVQNLTVDNNCWQLNLNNNEFVHSKNVILAVGAEPQTLSYPRLKTISLEVALDREKLSKLNCENKTIAVFGSSHSGVLAIRNLYEYCKFKKIINFYRNPLRYAVDLGDMILFDNTGLKGTTAQWAKEHLQDTLPEKLERLSVSTGLQDALSQCTHAIYAVGFQQRVINVEGVQTFSYNTENGIIAPRLFGFGIAYPELKADRFGNLEYRVGLWKFMEYLSYVLPVWLG